jgi:hypothetical protein
MESDLKTIQKQVMDHIAVPNQLSSNVGAPVSAAPGRNVDAARTIADAAVTTNMFELGDLIEVEERGIGI